MKRCSTCNRTYTDPNLRFCIDDGTPLTPVETEDDTTVVRPRGNEDDQWNAVAYQPPAAYVPPGAEVKPRRRLWPWVVGIAGAFILGFLALSIFAVVMVQRKIREQQNPRIAVRQTENSNRAATTPNINSNSSNTNSNSSGDLNTPPPTDREQVLAHLKNLENEWMVANINADQKTLDRILADDYVGQASVEGGLETKADYLRRIKRDTQTAKWDMSDVKLTLTGDRATLTGVVTFYSHEGGRATFDFRDKFVWRAARWQATGSELKPRENIGTDL
ncbi:MAG TPA: nuclear transport factor 2 family protein [Pyrinomonadaceae bacterium]|nr:nuclear transport factor 2 family protein [Pyrinomonadaceae bacterium]